MKQWSLRDDFVSQARVWNSPCAQRFVAVWISLASAVMLSLSSCTLIESTAPPKKPTTATIATSPPVKEKPTPEVLSFADTVSKIQGLLAELGYDPGPVDGVVGPRTRSGIRNYQADHGLSADGQISFAILEHIEATTATLRQEAGLQGTQAELDPVYAAGDHFAYSNGLIERIVSVDGDIIVSETNRGVRAVSHRNFTLPPLSRETAEETSRSALDTARAELWTRKFGEDLFFTSQYMTKARGHEDKVAKTEQKWRCTLRSRETVSVAAGTFETLRIECRLLTQSAHLPKERIWFFAPSIGHYVRRDDIYGAADRNQSLELVAIWPAHGDWPPAARAGFGWAFQHSLEALSTGEVTEWQSSGVDVRVAIQPAAKFRRADGTYCRTFTQSLTNSGGTRQYPGLACREDSKRRWMIPGLDGLPGLSDSYTGQEAISQLLPPSPAQVK